MNYILFKDILAWGDAASNDCIQMQKILKKNGKNAILSSFNRNIKLKDFLPFEKLNLNQEDIIILHSFNNEKIIQFILKTKAKKILRYHNITPPHYFQFWNHHLFKECQKELNLLKEYKNYFDFTLPVSQFNQNHLKELGFTIPSEVLPFLMELPNQTNNNNTNNLINILFIGRIAPNKKIEDILKSFAYYQKIYHPNSQLNLIGGSPCPFYTKMLKEYAKHLKIKNLNFTGEKSTQKELLQAYQTCDLFLCLSEHEGFCVPLLESMAFQKPILAFNIPAVAETLNDSGFLLNHKNPLFIANIMHQILNNQNLKENIIQKQNERLKHFNLNLLENVFLKQLKNFERI